MIFQGEGVDESCIVYNGEPNLPILIGDTSNPRNIVSGSRFITNKGHFLDLGIEDSLMLVGVNVDLKDYNLMIIKGSNKPSSWTKDSAKEEAMSLFEFDLFNAFKQSEEIREYMAYPILNELLSQILWKHKHADEVGYDMLQYQQDLAKVRDLAVNEYHLNSTFVDEILNWLEKIEPEPPWWERVPYSWIFAGIIGFFICAVGERLLKKVLKRRKD